RLFRNAAIGAAVCSYRALFYRAWDVLPVMLAMGALSGCLYTWVEPAVRGRPRLHYLPWVLCSYLVLFGGVGLTGVLMHDEETIQTLTNPWFLGFVLLAGPIAAYAGARMFEDE